MKLRFMSFLFTLISITSCASQEPEIIVVTATQEPSSTATDIPEPTPTLEPIMVELALLSSVVNPITQQWEVYRIEYGVNGSVSSTVLTVSDILEIREDKATGVRKIWTKEYTVSSPSEFTMVATGWFDGACEISINGEPVSRQTYEVSIFAQEPGTSICRAIAP